MDTTAALPSKIWLDCDTGHDDAFALLLAAFSPGFDLLGVSTVHGNSSLENTTRNTCAVLHALGRPEVPVIRGSPAPLSREPSYAGSFHGLSGLDGVSLLPDVSQDTLSALPSGVDQIAASILNEPAGSVALVATGPLTNLANLFKQCPELVAHIHTLSIMGGAFGGQIKPPPPDRKDEPGNWRQWAESNMYRDPEAARAVFGDHRLAMKTILFPLDATHQCRAVPKVRAMLFEDAPKTGIRQLFGQIMDYFTTSYQRNSQIKDGPPLHDPLAVLGILKPTLFPDANCAFGDVVVDTSDVERGRTKLEPSYRTNCRGYRQVEVRVPLRFETGELWKTIDACLGNAETHLRQKV